MPSLLRRYEMHEAPNSFFIFAGLGLIISFILTVTDKIDKTWGTAFFIAFLVMLVSTLMAIAPKE
ncbi:MAG TPA: hypothetical protein ENN46_00130 [Candidatus Woesearchaeota archaeon]|nr:hypothetical protein [Candidatus Woesearchaeota archaeon]